MPTAAQEAVLAHVRRIFDGHEVEVVPFGDPKIEERVPGFSVIRAAPGPKVGGLWTYVTCGVWDAVHTGEHGLEFCILAPERDDERQAFCLALAAYYHANADHSYRLDVGHTVPLGEPWLTGSDLDHWYVSLPYPPGRDFEVCNWDSGHARLLWLQPITESERDFKAEHGGEALEQRFDDAAARYWDPQRPAVA